MRHIVFYIVFVFLSFSFTGLHAQSESITADTLFQDEYAEDTTAGTDSDLAADEETSSEEPDTNVLRTISEEDWQKIKSDKAFIYTRKKEKKLPTQKDTPPPPMRDVGNYLNSGVFKLLLYLLVFGIIGFIIYKLVTNSEFNYFKSRRKDKKATDFQTIDDVQTFSEWDAALEAAIQQRDYRLAVRILYLKTLQQLHQQSLIRYEPDKTNWEYVYELGNGPHRPAFTKLTRYFDYIWYGEFAVPDQTFHALHAEFKTFYTDIQS